MTRNQKKKLRRIFRVAKWCVGVVVFVPVWVPALCVFLIAQPLLQAPAETRAL